MSSINAKIHLAPCFFFLPGYVSLGFTPNPGKMANTDVVLGWVAADGSTMVDTFHTSGNNLGPQDKVAMRRDTFLSSFLVALLSQAFYRSI